MDNRKSPGLDSASPHARPSNSILLTSFSSIFLRILFFSNFLFILWLSTIKIQVKNINITNKNKIKQIKTQYSTRFLQIFLQKKIVFILFLVFD